MLKRASVAKDTLVESNRLSMERGVEVDVLHEKSEQLVATSYTYKKKAKDVESHMCWQKWKFYIIGVLIVIGIITVIVLIVKL